MLKELNIALFADADNCGLEYSHFDNTLFQLNEMGNVCLLYTSDAADD